MKNLVHSFLILSLIVPVRFSSAADKTSQQDWKNLMTHQMRLTLAMHYSFLSTDTANLMIAIAYKIRERNHRLATLERQTLGTANLFSSTGDTDSKLVRELALSAKEASLLDSQSKTDFQILERVAASRVSQCDLDKVSSYREFDYPNLIPLNGILADMNKTINNAIVAEQPFSIGISYGSNYGMTVSSDGSGFGSSQDPKTAFKVVTSAIGSYGGAKIGAAIGTAALPGIGTAIGAAIGWLVGEIILGIIFGGETIYDKLADHYRDEIKGAHSAFQALIGEKKSQEVVRNVCEGVFKNEDNQKVVASIVETVRRETGLGAVSAAAVTQTATDALESYEKSLSELQSEILPRMAEAFQSKFEKYLDELQARSQESKVYFKEQVAPLLKHALDDKQPIVQVEQQHALWSKLIRGEARFTQRTGFAWDAESEKEDETVHLQYWDTVREPVVRRLRGAL